MSTDSPRPARRNTGAPNVFVVFVVVAIVLAGVAWVVWKSGVLS